MKGITLPFSDVRYDMINPKVQQVGDAALLSFNLVNYAKTSPDATESVLNRWNATQLYVKRHAVWTIVHTHWSFVKPESSLAS